MFILTVLLEVLEWYCRLFEQDFVSLIVNFPFIVLALKLHFSVNVSSLETLLYYSAFLNCCGWLFFMVLSSVYLGHGLKLFLSC